jgi:uncharacterized protein YaeQ
MNKKLLELLFSKHGSDKADPHAYHETYGDILPKTLDNLLEVGISNTDANHSSLHAWSELYPDAKIWGADIVIEKLINHGNISSYYLDQSSVESLNNFKSFLKNKFDVIIDDGSHYFEHAKLTLELLLENLKDDGVYCIEDIAKEYLWYCNQTVKQWEDYLNTRKDITYEVYDSRPDLGNADDSIVICIRKKL